METEIKEINFLYLKINALTAENLKLRHAKSRWETKYNKSIEFLKQYIKAYDDDNKENEVIL